MLSTLLAEKRDERHATLNSTQWSITLTGFAIVGAVILRIALSNYSLWLDEYASLHFAHQVPGLLWSDWMIGETNPPLFYAFLQGWLALGANSVVTLRLLPILGGAIELILLAIICTKWWGHRSSVFAVILVGLSAQNIFYSHLLRGYIFELDGVILSLIGLLLIFNEKDKRWLGWSLHVAGCLIAIYCHTTMFLWAAISTIAMICVGWHQLWEENGKLFKQLIVASFVIALGSSWWLYITLEQLRLGATNISWNKTIGPREYIRQIMDACLLTYDFYDRDKVATNTVAMLTILGAIVTWRDRPARIIAVIGVMSFITFGVAGMVQPIIVQRTIFWMTIFPVLLISAGLAKLRSTYLAWAVMLFSAALLINHLQAQKSRFELEDWNTALKTVERDPKAVLLVQGEAMRRILIESCRLEYGAPECRFRLLTVEFANTKASARQNVQDLVPLADVRTHLRPDDRIYALHSYDFNPFKALNVRPANATMDWDDRFLQGPVDRKLIP